MFEFHNQIDQNFIHLLSSSLLFRGFTDLYLGAVIGL